MLDGKNRSALLPRLSKISTIPLLNLVPLNVEKSNVNRKSIDKPIVKPPPPKIFEEYRPRAESSETSSAQSTKERKKTLKKAHLASLKTKLDRSFQMSQDMTKVMDVTYAGGSVKDTEFEIDKLLLKNNSTYFRFRERGIDLRKDRNRGLKAKSEGKALKSLIHAVLSGFPQMVKPMLKDCVSVGERVRMVSARDPFERTALHYASFLGNVAVCEKLLVNGGNPSAKDHLSRTPLHYAVIGNKEQIIDVLVRFKNNQSKQEPSLSHHRSSSTTLLLSVDQPLTDAINFTRGELSEFASIMQEMDGLTTDAATPGFKPNRVVGESKYVDCQDKYYRTPLHYAAIKESYRAIKVLCTIGASLDLEDCQRKRPADCSEHQSLKKFLMSRMRLSYGQGDPHLSLDLRDLTSLSLKDIQHAIFPPNHDTYLMQAVRRRQENAVKFLLDHGAILAKTNKSHWNALHLAVKLAFMPVLRIILPEDHNNPPAWKLEAWKALDMVTSEGYSVLHLAAKQSDSSEAVQYLIKHIMLRKAWAESQQTKPDSEQLTFTPFETLRELRCKGGYTALLMAVKSYNLGIVKYLVKQGANLYAKTELLQNAMHIAAQQEDKDMLEFLVYQDSDDNVLRAEVDIRMRKPKDIDISGKLASSFFHIWDYAALGNISKIKALVSTGNLSVNEQTKHKLNSVLHVAVEKAQVICVRELMDMGADPNVRNAAGKTPADVAAVIKDARYESVIYRLIKGEGADGFEDVELQALSQAYRPFVQIQLPPEEHREVKSYSEEWTPEKRALVALLRDKLVERGMSVADAFELVDKDKDFCLEKIEFEGLLLWLGIHASTAQVAELLHSLDHYRTGRIEYAAVVNHIKEANKMVQERTAAEEGGKSQGINLSSKLFRGSLKPLDRSSAQLG